MTAHFTPKSSSHLQAFSPPAFSTDPQTRPFPIPPPSDLLFDTGRQKWNQHLWKAFLTIRAVQQWISAHFEISLLVCRLYLKKLGRGRGELLQMWWASVFVCPTSMTFSLGLGLKFIWVNNQSLLSTGWLGQLARCPTLL